VLERLLLTTGLIVACIAIYRYRKAIAAALRRFDEDNQERIAGEIRDRSDQLAHFRHTLARAEEQVEAVEAVEVQDDRTGTPVARFLFEGQLFATRRDAERAREEKVRALARAFYMDLPTALTARRNDERLQ
jgi:hypothetical protein